MDKDAYSSADLEDIGPKVRRLRQERGISQDSLSIRASVDQSGLSKFERGGRGIGEVALRRIAAALGLSYEDLIKGTNLDAREADDAAR